MLDVVGGNPKPSQQVLLLAHLYVRSDTNPPVWLRSALVKPRWGDGQHLDKVCGGGRVVSALSL
jgi:hypothetical protein